MEAAQLVKVAAVLLFRTPGAPITNWQAALLFFCRQWFRRINICFDGFRGPDPTWQQLDNFYLTIAQRVTPRHDIARLNLGGRFGADII